jgi:endothelin-converting enzyme
MADNAAMETILEIAKESNYSPTVEVQYPGSAETLTGAQVFFTQFAHAWCSVVPAEAAKAMLPVDVHSPPKIRVHGTLRNQNAFAKAFKCPLSRNQCHILN